MWLSAFALSNTDTVKLLLNLFQRALLTWARRLMETSRVCDPDSKLSPRLELLTAVRHEYSFGAQRFELD